MIWCSFCDNEAIHITPAGSGLCATCAAAYELGQCEPDEVLGDAEDPEYRARYYKRHPEYTDEE